MDSILMRQLARTSRMMPDDLVRMDRAAIYLRNRTTELLVDLRAKATKTVGEYAYRINSYAREMLSLTRMAGEPLLVANAKELFSVSPRTPRDHVISRLQELIVTLENYQVASERDEAIFEESESGKGDGTTASVADVNAVFVIMPFRQEFNDVWIGGIRRACTELELNPIRVDMINKSTNITDDIVKSIESCHIAIADVTENNPNVMFELGYAMAKKKPIVIISQSSDFLPFDIRHLRTIVYSNTWSGVEELKNKIKLFLEEARSKGKTPKAITKKAVRTKSRKG